MQEIPTDKTQPPTTSSPQRLKVLISAYTCEPNKGSEPGVGWNVVNEVSRHHDVWVLTREDRRESIEPEIAQNPVPNVNFIYYDLPYWMRFWRKKQRGQRIHYHMWQIGAYWAAKAAHEKHKFDLIHHVTYVRYWTPSFVSFLDVPFIWGSVGGGESTPESFMDTLSEEGKKHERVRNTLRTIGHNDPFVRMTANRADRRLVTTPQTEERVRQLTSKPIQIMPETALPDEDRLRLQQIPLRDEDPFRLVSLGRLLDWKGFHLGLQAFAKFQEKYPSSEYWIIGDGPQRQFLENLVDELGIREKVRFWGRVPREQVLQCLEDCNALVHPSLHDSGGWVCLESMAARRPVICLNLGGPGVQVTEETGFKINAGTPEQAVSDMADAMYKLASDPDLRRRMGEAGLRRVEQDFSWKAKGEAFDQLYRQVIRQ